VLNAQLVQSDCHYLQNEANNYVQRLTRLAADLLRAKEEGCFLKSRNHHLSLLHQAEKRLRRVQKMAPAIQQLIQQLSTSSAQQEATALAGLQTLGNESSLQPSAIAQICGQLPAKNAHTLNHQELQRIRKSF
jgi:hypothetical protein